jgi:hypothetical protein
MKCLRLSIVIALSLLVPRIALAECPKWPDDIRALAKSSAMVFSGTVKKIESVSGANWGGAERVTFDVERVWRGATSKQVVLYNSSNHSGNSFSDVGFPIQRGNKYLVFANRQTREERTAFGLAASATFGIGTCGGGSRPYDEANTEIAKLGPGRAIR